MHPVSTDPLIRCLPNFLELSSHFTICICYNYTHMHLQRLYIVELIILYVVQRLIFSINQLPCRNKIKTLSGLRIIHICIHIKSNLFCEIVLQRSSLKWIIQRLSMCIVYKASNESYRMVYSVVALIDRQYRRWEP